MTRAERTLREKIRRRARAHVGRLSARQMAAYDVIRGSLNEIELARAISDGTLDELLERLFSDEALEGPFARLRAHIDAMTLQEGAVASEGLPRAYRVAFDMLNPLVTRAVQTLDTTVIKGLKDEVRETVRNHVLAGVQDGTNPRSIARGVRRMIGLAPNQEAAIRNFERMLTEGDLEALTRALRDKRFDGTVRKAFASGKGLSRTQINQMTEAYRRRMIAFNAETHARTIALDSQRLAQRLAWDNAVAKGIVERGQLVKTWIAVGGPGGDGRNRPEHLELHGTTVQIDQPFPNGEDIPGDSTFNCRCVERVTVNRDAVSTTPEGPPEEPPTVVEPVDRVPEFATIQEAEAWAEQRWPHPRGRRQFDYSQMDVATANRLNRLLAAAEDENVIFPPTSVGPEKARGAVAEMAAQDTRFFYRPGQSEQRQLAIWDHGTSKGDDWFAGFRLPRNQFADDMVHHEIGHMVDYKLRAVGKGAYAGVEGAEGYERAAKSLSRKFSTAYNRANEAGRLPSTYSVVGGRDEGFAEVYSLLRMNRDMLDTRLVGIMDEILTFLRGVR